MLKSFWWWHVNFVEGAKASGEEHWPPALTAVGAGIHQPVLDLWCTVSPSPFPGVCALPGDVISQ